MQENGKSGFIDKTGRMVIPLEWEASVQFSEGLAQVVRDKKWGFIDHTGKLVVESQWDLPPNLRTAWRP